MTSVICINDWYLIPGVSEHAWSCLITWLSSPLRLAPLEFFRAINMLSTSTTPSPSASNCPKACGRNTESIVTPNIWTQSPAFLHTKGKFNKCSLTVYCSSWIWFNRVLCCFYPMEYCKLFYKCGNNSNIPRNPTQCDKAALCYNRPHLKTRGK